MEEFLDVKVTFYFLCWVIFIYGEVESDKREENGDRPKCIYKTKA